MIPDLQRVLDVNYLAGINDAPPEELRAMRAECADLENAVSYVRRLAQGRLDLLGAETQRRAEGGGGDLGDLVDRLPELLSGGLTAPGSGRADQDLEPPAHLVDPLSEVLDGAVGPSVMTSLPDLGNDELTVALTTLTGVEDDLSTSRRSLHSTIDALNDELARRIADGEPATGT